LTNKVLKLTIIADIQRGMTVVRYHEDKLDRIKPNWINKICVRNLVITERDNARDLSFEAHRQSKGLQI